jgi:hypothetical protein
LIASFVHAKIHGTGCFLFPGDETWRQLVLLLYVILKEDQLLLATVTGPSLL